MTSMEILIERGLHAFVFKWKDYLDITSGSHSSHNSVNWNTFLNIRKNYLKIITNGLLNPIYSERRTSEHVFHFVDIPSPDVAVCEYLCYPGDKIIRMYGVHDDETDKDMYVVISAYGSIIKKTNSDVCIVKMGLIQYTDEIVKLVKLIKCNNSLNLWIKMIEDLDIIQKNIMLLHEIKKI